MLRSYVCRRCTLPLSRRVAHVRSPQWQQRSTFITLRTKDTEDDATPTKIEPNSQTSPDTSQSQTPNKLNIRYASPTLPPSVEPARRYAEYVPEGAGVGSLAPETYPANISYAEEAELDPEAGISFVNPIYKALQKGAIPRAWALFEKVYTSKDCEALTNPPPKDLVLLEDGKMFLDLMRAIIADFCNGKSDLAVTPTNVLFKYEQLGIARPEYWSRKTLEYFTRRIILAVNCPSDKPQLNLESMLFELLSVWRLFFQCKGRRETSLNEIDADWHLPAIESFPTMFSEKNFFQRLQIYHPKHRGNHTLAFTAVYLYTISDALNSVDVLKQQAAPLLQFLERLLAGSSVAGLENYMHTWLFFQTLPPEVQEQIRNEIKDAPRRALASIGETGEISSQRTGETGDATVNLEEFYLKLIARAVESRSSLSVLEGLWEQVEKQYVQTQEAKVPPKIYNAFLAGFMALKAPQESVRIWNHMINSDVRPDMQSWIALLDGCARSRDLDGFNGVWSRLLKTGMELDNYAWTSRVNGLVSMRQVELGLAALDEMGKKWLSAEAIKTESENPSKKKKTGMKKVVKKLPKTAVVVNNCTKPSVEVVNGAMSGLVQMRDLRLKPAQRIDSVQKILRWARHFDIKPDIRTYNILLQLYLNAGENQTAFKVLKQMEKDGLEGDIATYTILITAMFDGNQLDGLNAADQVKRMLSLLATLEAAGIKLNDYIYATAIDKLLKQYSNHDAVRVLIDHMMTRNLVPNAFVYSSLVTHYFQLKPPALNAVDSLITQAFDNHRLPIDRMMLDRVLEGFAMYDDVERMKKVLNRMKSQKRLTSWKALKEVVLALVRNGENEHAREIIRAIENGQGMARPELGTTQNQSQFFHTVRGLDLGSETQHVNIVPSENENMEARASQDEADQYPPENEMQQQQQQQAQRMEDAHEEIEDVHEYLSNDPEREYRQSQRG